MSVNVYNKNTNELKNIAGGGTGGGADYDIEVSANKDSVTLTEDSTDKTTLPLISEFIGTRAEWDALSATEQANYRKVNITDEVYEGDSEALVKANSALNNQASSVETGNIATEAHNQGDYILYGNGNQFAEVLSDIAIGDTLSTETNGNIKLLTQGEVLTNLNSALSNTVTNKGNTPIFVSTGTAIYNLVENGFDITKPIFGFINSNNMAFDFCIIPYPGNHIANGYSAIVTQGLGASADITIGANRDTIRIHQVFVNGVEYTSGATLHIYPQN